ncbi:cytochrome P450 family protein [Thermoactinospora rubra]|uniref:cytochrome P450 family protein n=1 Tax=Thermoactinospora rubra TaxID=1088767 RepID=UPI000A0FFCBE|nr:cytochrome P450 [Thermoactinospora rubra]
MTETLPFEFYFSPEFGADPYSAYAGLRDKGPVHPIDFPPGSSAYLVLDYEYGRSLLGDPRLSKDLGNGPEWFRDMVSAGNPVLAYNMLMSDPPDHTRLRKAVGKAFTPRRVEQLRPRIQQITDELVDALPEDEADLIDAFAFPLPIIVICELLGVPTADRASFREWSGTLIAPALSEEEAARRHEANAAVREYFTRQIALRRADPRDDLVTALATSPDLNENELLSTLVLLLIAGHETTVNLIGNGMLALLTHPGQLALLRERPELLPSAVEEFLRFDAPVERGTFRIALEDIDVAGTTIPKGSFVHVSIAAADRDPRAFPEPDRLDITREDNRHLAFGHGIHFCLGAPLARVEGRIAFETLLRRRPAIRLAVEPRELSWRFNGAVVRGLAALPVRF